MIVYRNAHRDPEPVRAPPTAFWRRFKAQLRGVPHRLEMRRAWLKLPAEARLELRRAGLRRELLRLADVRLFEEATERVEAACYYERAMASYMRRAGGERSVDELLASLDDPPRASPRPVPTPPANSPSDMQRAIACSGTSVRSAIEALREGLLSYYVMQIVRGR